MAANLILQLVNFYTWLIIAYVLMSWFPLSGVLADIQRVLATLVEPYLSIFRRFIPPIGMIDISALVAILVLEAAAGLLARVL